MGPVGYIAFAWRHHLHADQLITEQFADCNYHYSLIGYAVLYKVCFIHLADFRISNLNEQRVTVKFSNKLRKPMGETFDMLKPANDNIAKKQVTSFSRHGCFKDCCQLIEDDDHPGFSCMTYTSIKSIPGYG